MDLTLLTLLTLFLCSFGVENLRGVNYHTNTANSIHVFFPACFIPENPWVNPMMMSGKKGTVPRAIPADYYESAQEILVVMNPPVGQ